MNKVFFSSQSFYWNTPKYIFDELNDEFNFTLDPCASNGDLIDHFYGEYENGLSKSWINENVFCNPPYNDIYKWVEKSYFEWKYNNALVVLLIPSRTDTKWFHKYLIHNCEIRFVEGRLHFNNSKNPAPFPSMICIFHRNNYNFN